ncbi:NAD(P)/FAD-dependent oxidoreductase [Candidatus Uhrbacteria bacterium]|nr:NAD(P)/FAD-dependent oxidoreductase [Candidatus Uhrbacteria bacterium]
MFDVVIVGGGPAGMAAAVYLARQKLSFAMFSGVLGGQAIWSSDVENYLGVHHVSGIQLVELFQKHLDDYKKAMDLHEDELVTSITRGQGSFIIETAKGAYHSKTVLITTGSDHRKLNIPGEDTYFMKGVTYCATCDAPLFAGKRVFVIGGGNSAMDAALFLEKYTKDVHLVTVNAELSGDAVLKRKCETSPSIKVLPNTKTVRFEGKDMLENIVLMKDGKEFIEPADGVFIEIGLIPQSGFIDFVQKDKREQIIIDKHGRTSVEGIWSAGDVTDVTEKQISVAVGEGSKAAIDIIRYLQSSQK